MQKPLIAVLLALFMIPPTQASSIDLTACDALYAKRGESLFAAHDCYTSLLAQATPSDQKTIYERVFIALSGVVSFEPKTANERRAIDLGIKLVEKMKTDLAGSADAHYWSAVFLSFDAMQVDRGAILPRRTFGAIKTIQSELKQAMNLDPALHSYGPHRVLGTMHTQMPGIVGGDKKLAENLLKVAYENAPSMSANQYAYGNILSVNGKTEEAKRVLTQFLAMSDESLNPYPEAPFRLPKAEIESDRKKAKQILDDLNEESTR